MCVHEQRLLRRVPGLRQHRGLFGHRAGDRRDGVCGGHGPDGFSVEELPSRWRRDRARPDPHRVGGAARLHPDRAPAQRLGPQASRVRESDGRHSPGHRHGRALPRHVAGGRGRRLCVQHHQRRAELQRGPDLGPDRLRHRLAHGLHADRGRGAGGKPRPYPHAAARHGYRDRVRADGCQPLDDAGRQRRARRGGQPAADARLCRGRSAGLRAAPARPQRRGLRRPRRGAGCLGEGRGSRPRDGAGAFGARQVDRAEDRVGSPSWHRHALHGLSLRQPRWPRSRWTCAPGSCR